MRWRVVGGSDSGGLLVRQGQTLKSPQEPERLSCGAEVEQLELVQLRGLEIHVKLKKTRHLHRYRA